MYTRNDRESYTTYHGKLSTHLKQFWSNNQCNRELPFTSIKQEAEHFRRSKRC